MFHIIHSIAADEDSSSLIKNTNILIATHFQENRAINCEHV